MKTLLPIFVLLAGTAFSQTTLIAHKSHSGTASTFAFADPGNFGLPPTRLVKVTKVNDTVVVLAHDNFARQWTDTIYNHPVFSDPNIPVDSMKKMYYDGVEFKGFEKKVVEPMPEDTLPVKPKAQPDKKEPQKTTTSHPKKRKNNLLLLWIIGGGTFTGVILLSRRRRGKLISA